LLKLIPKSFSNLALSPLVTLGLWDWNMW